MKSLRRTVLELLHIKRENFCILFFTIFLICACQESPSSSLSKAKNKAESANFKEAENDLEILVKKFPDSRQSVDAAIEGAKLVRLETKNFQKGLFFLKHIVLYSKYLDERLTAQKQLVAILYDELNDYKSAVSEINRLIVQLRNKSEIADYKMKLAKSYFYLNDLDQAEHEVDEFLLSKDLDPKKKFELLTLKGNILLASKDLPNASKVYQKVLKEFPEFSRAENVAVTLAVCYEEMKDFKSAIELLTSVRSEHPTPRYIDSKIEKLKERQKNAPGAKGMRK
jgi:tetratricopeptide (TPR) repeat protein